MRPSFRSNEGCQATAYCRIHPASSRAANGAATYHVCVMPPAAASQPDPDYLRIRESDHQEPWRFPLTQRTVVIGRGENADLRLKSDRVSRRHAELFRDPTDRLWIRDLKSRNGVKVNDVPITEAVVCPHDCIEIGPFKLTYMPGGQTGESHSTIDAPSPTILTVENDSVSRIEAHNWSGPTKIDVSHIKVLNEFQMELATHEDRQHRLETLCAIMVRPEFHAMSAVAVRINRVGEQLTPRELAPPAFAAGQPRQVPHLSNRLLTAVRADPRPALATTSPGGGDGRIEMTIVTSSGPGGVGAIACPLRVTERELDLLYLSVPIIYAEPQWLALAALAAQHFQHAEMLQDARRQAIHKAQIESDLRRAQEIQSRLIPRNPNVPGVEIAIGYQPCRWVGGDYLDVIHMPDGRVAFIVADVSGKGLPAALVTTALHAHVRASLNAGASLAHMMRDLNDHLRTHLEMGTFVTMAVMVMNPATGQIECVNAGHLAPLILNGQSAVACLQHAEHLPLSIEDQSFIPSAGLLESSHVMAAFTDGLTELTDEAGQMLGAEGVTAMLKRAVHLPLDEAARRINEQLDALNGNRVQPDDRTFLLVRKL